jgi:hypothetical protein
MTQLSKYIIFTTFAPNSSPRIFDGWCEGITAVLGTTEHSKMLETKDYRKYNYLSANDASNESFKKNNSFLTKIPDFKFRPDLFGYKILAIKAMLEAFPNNDLVWMDSDIILNENPQNYLEKIRPEKGDLFSYYDRLDTYDFAETGVMFFSKEGTSMSLVFFEFLHGLVTSNKVFEEDQWHDAYLIRKFATEKNLAVTNLCKKFNLVTTNPIFEHSDARSVLIHSKGNRKRMKINKVLFIDYSRLLFEICRYYLAKLLFWR